MKQSSGVSSIHWDLQTPVLISWVALPLCWPERRVGKSHSGSQTIHKLPRDLSQIQRFENWFEAKRLLLVSVQKATQLKTWTCYAIVVVLWSCTGEVIRRLSQEWVLKITGTGMLICIHFWTSQINLHSVPKADSAHHKISFFFCHSFAGHWQSNWIFLRFKATLSLQMHLVTRMNRNGCRDIPLTSTRRKGSKHKTNSNNMRKPWLKQHQMNPGTPKKDFLTTKYSSNMLKNTSQAQTCVLRFC